MVGTSGRIPPSTGRLTHHEADTLWNEPTPAPVRWSAGEWSLELRGDEIKELRHNSTLIVRGIRAVVRDRDWATVPVVVERVDVGPTRIAIDVTMAGLGARVRGTVTLLARGNRLYVEFQARSETSFHSNRLGLVILHPPTLAGTRVLVRDPSGGSTETSFPIRISPHQPATNIAELRWRHGHSDVSIILGGEVFEMEDQRNWTDASFKTYSTPLDRPFPVLIPSGGEVCQWVVIAVSPADSVETIVAPHDAVANRTPRPCVDVVVAASALGATGLMRSPTTTMLVELHESADWRGLLGSVPPSTDLDVRIITSHPDVEEFLDALLRHRVVRVGIFSAVTHVTEPELWEALTHSVRRRNLDVELVAGTRAHFTELNRSARAVPADADSVTFSITPMMHTTDRMQLIESIAMQREVALNAVRIAAGRPVHVGPVTLRPRFNAVATSGATAGPEVDPRQSSPALAAWTIASAAALSVPGVASVCWFEASGPHGIATDAGEAYAVAEAVRWLHDLRGAELGSADEVASRVWILSAARDGQVTVLIGNLRDEGIDVRWGPPGSSATHVPAYGAIRLTGTADHTPTVLTDHDE